MVIECSCSLSDKRARLIKVEAPLAEAYLLALSRSRDRSPEPCASTSHLPLSASSPAYVTELLHADIAYGVERCCSSVSYNAVCRAHSTA